MGKKYFFHKNNLGGQNICLVQISLNFSTWKEFDTDLNAGRSGVQGQLHGKISEEARMGTK